jgi:hypothetical protein
MQGATPAHRIASTSGDESDPAFWQATSTAVLKALPEALSIPSMPAERHFVKGVFSSQQVYWLLRTEDFTSARCCDSSETGSKLVIVITEQIFGGLPIGGGFPKLPRYPGIGRESGNADMNHSPCLEEGVEEGKEGAKVEIRHRKAHHKPRRFGHGCAGMSSTSVLLAAGRERTSCTSGWSACTPDCPA